MKAQVGVWKFAYEKRDIRDKSIHPAAFPIALARRCIDLFTHRGELVLDPFVGSGTTLVAARDAGRNAIGIDLNPRYVDLCRNRLGAEPPRDDCRQVAMCADARDTTAFIQPATVALVLTSPPYANLLNRKRKNKSRRGDLRRNSQYGKVEQYSQDPRDLGILGIHEYSTAMASIFESIRPLLKAGAHCVVNVPDMWWDGTRVTIHVSLIEAFRGVGYELRNIIIWDRTNVVNRVGIFGWPSNYITMGVTFEYLLDFIAPRR